MLCTVNPATIRAAIARLANACRGERRSTAVHAPEKTISTPAKNA